MVKWITYMYVHYVHKHTRLFRWTALSHQRWNHCLQHQFFIAVVKDRLPENFLKSLCGCLIGGRHCMHVFIVLTGVSTLFCWVKQLKTVLRVFESVQRVSCRKTVRHWNSHPVLCNPLSSKEECSVQFKMFSTCFAKLYISLLGQMTEDCWEFLRVCRECLMQEISQALKSTSSFM